MGRLLSRHQLPNIGCGVRCVRMLRPFLKIFRAPSTSRLLTRASLAQVSGGFQPRVTSSNHVFGIRLRPVIEHERLVPLLLVLASQDRRKRCTHRVSSRWLHFRSRVSDDKAPCVTQFPYRTTTCAFPVRPSFPYFSRIRSINRPAEDLRFVQAVNLIAR
jgi:hypothetical protein